VARSGVPCRVAYLTTTVQLCRIHPGRGGDRRDALAVDGDAAAVPSEVALATAFVAPIESLAAAGDSTWHCPVRSSLPCGSCSLCFVVRTLSSFFFFLVSTVDKRPAGLFDLASLASSPTKRECLAIYIHRTDVSAHARLRLLVEYIVPEDSCYMVIRQKMRMIRKP